jgi:hypothetical protein
MNDGHSGDACFSEERGGGGDATRWIEAAAAPGDEQTMQQRRGRRASEWSWKTGDVGRQASGGTGR